MENPENKPAVLLPAGSPGSFIPPTPQELAARIPNLEVLELLGRAAVLPELHLGLAAAAHRCTRDASDA